MVVESVPRTEPLAPAAPVDPNVIKTLGIHTGKGRGRAVIKAVIIILLLALAGGAIFRCVRQQTAKAVTEYRTAEVGTADIRVTITATGTVKGLNTVEVGAETSGKITKVYVDFNDRVKRGQILAEIDPEQQRAAVDESSARVSAANAAIREARATLNEAKLNLARIEQQAKDGLVSQKELESSRASAERAEASLSNALASATVSRATLTSTKSKLEKTTIASPIDGIVLARLVEPGQTVAAGLQTPVLFKLAEDLSRMQLHGFIDESDVGRAKEGQDASFTVDAYPDKVFPSKLVSLRNEPRTEQNVVTYEAVLAVDNAELLLRPGMTATATIIAEIRKDVLAVPNAALRFTPPEVAASAGAGRGGGVGIRIPGVSGGGRSGAPKKVQEAGAKPKRRVWILEGGVPKAVSVETGVSDGRVTEILGGELTKGAQVLVDVVEKE